MVPRARILPLRGTRAVPDATESARRPIALDNGRVRELVARYDRPGSRYTSYPSAAEFSPAVGPDTVATYLEPRAREPRPLALYVHLPFCQSLCWYCGCTTVITSRQQASADYLSVLERELELMAPHVHGASPVVQVHLGGGTPTFLLPEEILRLGESLRRHFCMASVMEAGVEIDPRRLTREHVDALRETGFNRASLGVQDHDPMVQRAVHRIQPRELTVQALRWVRDAGFRSVNVDLIYGLPHQTVASFARTLDDVLVLAPDRVAVFSYAHVPWMKPAQKLLQSGALPSAEAKLDILLYTVDRMQDAGYVYIGMDHFARADDELAVAQREGTLQRNFQGYSTHADTDLFGFGLSAISQAPGIYWQNDKTLAQYVALVDGGTIPVARGVLLSHDDWLRQQLIRRLMCDTRLDFEALSRRLGVDVVAYFARELAELGALEADGLVECRDDGLVVTPIGRLLLRNLAMCFDPRAPLAPARRYSRTI
jgi:oxygen-independent coproporphyrinogen-3 oxidase